MNTKYSEFTIDNNFPYGRRICACCGFVDVDFFDICDICGWQNDSLQNKYPDYKGGANQMSLNEAKEAYKNDEDVY